MALTDNRDRVSPDADLGGPGRVHRLGKSRLGELELVYEHLRAPVAPTAAPPVYVLVHGIGMGRRTLLPLAEDLATDGDAWVVDLPGFGDAPEPARAPTMADLGALVAAFVRDVVRPRTAPGRPLVLIGHSMGTQVATETAAQAPELVDGLVLIAPTINPAERHATVQALRLVQDLAVESVGVLVTGLTEYLRSDPRWFFTVLAKMLTHRAEERLPAVQAPTLVLRGSLDHVSPRDWAQQVARLVPDARAADVPGQSHGTLLRDPHPIAALVRRFALRRFGAEPSASPD
ncbi:alpha/beta fold hydrolase [Luteimicrobium album]|uniref:alpha/beta fold hydrolase n=1 Tax=Luteimicrobium album TaxID=1054550 RepID=UPI0024E0B8B8|nr:alpha/beta fold hydrolase [Luteimicrobium album]